MTTQLDPYAILGVDRRADRTTIRTVCRALARRYHPDMPGGSAAHMVQFNAAWSMLRDASVRKASDRRQARPVAPAPPAAEAPSPRPKPAARVLDFGRYEGWSVDALARHEPDYLDWLTRTPNGRRYRAAIEDARACSMTRARAPDKAPSRGRRGIWGRR